MIISKLLVINCLHVVSSILKRKFLKNLKSYVKLLFSSQNLFAAMSQDTTMTLPRKRGAVVLSKDGMATISRGKETSA